MKFPKWDPKHNMEESAPLGSYTTEEEKKRSEHWRTISILLMIYDIIAVNMSYFLALWFRFDCTFSKIYWFYLDSWIRFIPVYTLICLFTFTVFRLYRSIWRFASFVELINIVKATLVTTVLHTVLITILFRRMPISYYVVGAMLQFVLCTGVRFAYRFINLLREARSGGADVKNVMLIGAGSAGQILLRDMQRTKELREKVVWIIDDNPNKWNRYIDNLLGTLHPNVVKETLMELGYESFFAGTKQIRKNREVYDGNIPWLILMDPTSACNLHCIRCWASEYNHKLGLTFDAMDSVIQQGKELGIHFYLFTGGEPLVRKKDIVALAKKHHDCAFHIFTNGTLIDEKFCKDMQDLGNISVAVSLEGFEEVNDGR